MRYFERYGPWAGTARGLGRASRAGTARKKAHRAVPGPEAKHEARSGTAREARRPVSARKASGRASPTSCRAGPGRPIGHLYKQVGVKARDESQPGTKKSNISQTSTFAGLDISSTYEI